MAKATSRQKKSFKAFSLLEALCVLGILGLILCMTLPRLSQTQDRALDRLCVRQVMGDMRFCQSQAMRSGYPASMRVQNSHSNTYIMNYKDLDGKSHTQIKTLPGALTMGTTPGLSAFVNYKSDGTSDRFYTVVFYREGAYLWKLIPYQSGQVRVERYSP